MIFITNIVLYITDIGSYKVKGLKGKQKGKCVLTIFLI